MKKVLDIFKKVFDVFKKPQWLLCLGLGIVMVMSLLANVANTSGYKVSVTEVSFETEHGNLTGLLYRPKSCTKETPCATIVTTHGYLNSKEMQDAPAIELSRRGYVVLAMDMYDHGDSTWDTSDYGSFMFFRWSQYDAVQWAYEQEFVLKDPVTGKGMIAVSGHSMGGFSSRVAAYFDSVDADRGEPQKIAAVLAVGADFSYVTWGTGTAEYVTYTQTLEPVYYTDLNGNKFYIPTDSTEEGTYMMVDSDGDGLKNDKVQAKVVMGYKAATNADVIAADAKYGRTMGTIAGRFDEFFFNPAGASGTVVEKDYTTTTEGNNFYNGGLTGTAKVAEFESGEWNDAAYNGGGSVIYVPNEIHPWNHFSTESTAYMVDFYTKAFQTQIGNSNITENDGVVVYGESKAQTWWLKAGFETVGLIGMFIAIIAAILCLVRVPFLRKVATDAAEINEVKSSAGVRAWLMRGLVVLSCAATAYVYPMIQLSTTGAYTESVKALMWGSALVLLASTVAYVVVKAVKGEDENANKVIGTAVVGAIAVFVTSFFTYWTLTKTFFADATYYNQPGTTPIAYWALVCSGLTAICLSIAHFVTNKGNGYTLANYGLKANWKQILLALLIAVVIVTGVYSITFLIEFVLRVDFRFWTYAIKPFGKDHLVTFVRYLPVFFLFYLVSAISTIANTGNDKSWKGTLKAILISAGGVAVLLGVHYGMDFVTGTAKFPSLALNMILLWALVPTLAISAWIARKSYFKTGNIWTAVFVNALLFTLMQVANTTLYLM